MALENKQRIIILGCAGSGKSTLAKALGEILDIPVYHLDKYFYKPGWIEEDKEVFYQKQLELVNQDKWIIDGNYIHTIDLRLARADLVIYLDFNRLVSFNGVIKRYFKFKNKQRDTIATGCIEKLDKSFLSWVWNFKKNAKPKLMEKLSHYNIELMTFKTRTQLKKWLKYVNE